MVRWALLVTVAVASCGRPSEHVCTSDTDCGDGVCVVPTGHCAFVDVQCCGGLRYGEGAGGSSGTCVATDACADAGRDGPEGDASMNDGPIDGVAVDAVTDAGVIVAAHLPPDESYVGTGDWTIVDNVYLDSIAGTVDVPLPVGVRLNSSTQLGGGPGVLVLHVRNLRIDASGELMADGNRPLIIVAQNVQIEGRVDVSGHLDGAGAGGFDPDEGPGAGGVGAVNGVTSGGGGGAGFATSGAGGGLGGVSGTGGSAGAMYLDPLATVLMGGSGGGSAVSLVICTGPQRWGGAGGGGFQITAMTSIEISGSINAGGGGGTGGRRCGSTAIEAGSGGGSGGVIYLQAPMVTVRSTGVLAANGGGGGGAGGAAVGGNGGDGANGALGTTPAGGGTSPGARGGAGGAGSTAPAPGQPGGEDGGGGGGAVGRIVIRGAANVMGTASPTPFVAP
jgi:hypothetical protein